MRPDIQLSWQSGTEIPKHNTCVLAYDTNSQSMYTAYHDGEYWLTWVPDGTEPAALPFCPERWAYLTEEQYGTSSGFCERPPEGWYCTREPGHDGPCAAHEGVRELLKERKLEDMIAWIEELTDHCEKTLEQRGLKLSEETGEVIKALLIETGSPGARYREYDPDALLEECSDVFIVVMSIIYTHLKKNYPAYKDQFMAMLTKKLSKWQNIIDIESDLDRVVRGRR